MSISYSKPDKYTAATGFCLLVVDHGLYQEAHQQQIFSNKTTFIVSRTDKFMNSEFRGSHNSHIFTDSEARIIVMLSNRYHYPI